MISVGIDVHKKRCQACLKDEKGRPVQELSIPNTTEGVEQLRTPTGRLRRCQNSTGVHRQPLDPGLRRAQQTVQIQSRTGKPVQDTHHSRSQGQERQDGHGVLSDLVRADLIAESYVPSIEVREQRALLRQRRSLVEDTVAVKNRIHNQLDKYDLKPEYSDLFGKQGREWLRNLQLSSIDRTILDVNIKQLESLEEAIRSLTVKIAQEAAQNASRYDSKLKGFYQRLASRRGHQKAITAVARKILVSMYYVLKRQEEYQGQRDELLEKKIKRLQRTVDSSLQAE